MNSFGNYPLDIILVEAIMPCGFGIVNLQSAYLSKIQHLRREINYKEQGAQTAINEPQELEELSFRNWFLRLFKQENLMPSLAMRTSMSLAPS